MYSFTLFKFCSELYNSCYANPQLSKFNCQAKPRREPLSFVIAHSIIEQLKIQKEEIVAHLNEVQV